VSADVVIGEVYGGGGNSGAPYANDFVELHYHGSASVALTGWSVQYAGINVGNHLSGPAVGPLDYTAALFMVELTSPLTRWPARSPRRRRRRLRRASRR
jgi:hypothetical protein